MLKLEKIAKEATGSRKKKAKLIAKFNEECFVEDQTEVKLALLKMDRVCVNKISCSNKHSLIVSQSHFNSISALIRARFLRGARTTLDSLVLLNWLKDRRDFSLRVLCALKAKARTSSQTWHVVTTIA